LRLTVGCLLADELGIELRRIGGGARSRGPDQPETNPARLKPLAALIAVLEALRLSEPRTRSQPAVGELVPA
jgi:hypothetical protein